MNPPSKWIEVIDVRSPQGAARTVETLLRELVSDATGDRVDVFRRVSLDGDFLVELRHAAGPVDARGSDVGVRIASALRERGLVNHTVWVEE